VKEALVRKGILRPQPSPDAHEIPVGSIATVLVTSEDAAHPIEHAFDDHRGPGGTRWIAEQPGEQTIALAFDTPQTIRRVVLEVEEHEVSRTQELDLSVSRDGGRHYQELLRQEFNFSPDGTVFEREDWAIAEADVTHLRIRIRPDKGGKVCRASLTSLVLY
jgi:hypothetical protein